MLTLSQSHALHNPCSEVYQLALAVYGKEELLPETLLEAWWRRLPELFLLAYQGTELCAYISALPLETQAFKQTLAEDFDEKNLNPLSIIPFEQEASYQLYFSSIVVQPDFQGRGIALALCRAFLQKLLELYDEGKELDAMSAWVLSDKGAKMMSSLGMSFYKQARHGVMYYGRYSKSRLEQCLQKLA